MDCIFCKITKGEIPATKVYEDESSLAFLDIQPNNPGHTLVIPKEHSRNIFEIEEKNLCELISIVKKVAHAVRDGVNADGVNISINNERPAGQVIFHTHVHIIPRFEGDGFKHWTHKQYKDGEAEEIANKIRKFF